MQPQVLESLCLSVTWSAGVESRSMNPVRFEPGRDWFSKLKSVRISIRNQYIHRHTLILLISRPRPAPKSLEMLRAARGSLSSRDPRIENFGRVTFSLSIWRKEGLLYMWSCLVFMPYVHLEKGALSQSLWSCFFSPCRSRTWSQPSHQTLSRGWDAWRSPVFVILRALFKQFINEKCTNLTTLVCQSF